MAALIAPSMLAADFLHLEDAVQTVNAYADLFHLDIMDGHFVPNISFGFPVVESIAQAAMRPLDIHLMIRHPQTYIERFCNIPGAGMLSFHLDATREDPEPILGIIGNAGVKAGIAINPDIPVEKLFPYLDLCDFVLIMSVYAGFGGQSFMEETYGRVARTKEEITRRGLATRIEVDGGVSPKNARQLIECGVDILVAGSAVFKAQNPAEVIAAMRGE